MAELSVIERLDRLEYIIGAIAKFNGWEPIDEWAALVYEDRLKVDDPDSGFDDDGFQGNMGG